MDVKELIEKQKEEALLKNGGAWVLVADVLLSRVEELEVRMAMYESCAPDEDTTDDDLGEAEAVAAEEVVAVAVEKPPVVEKKEEPEVPPLKYGDSMSAHERVKLLLESGEAEKLRKKAGISVNAIARSLGVSHSGVRGWEKGKWLPGEKHAVAYLNILWNLQHGKTPEGLHQSGKHAAEPEGNGLHCVFCGGELHGGQKRFDTQSCARAYSYLKRLNPGATQEQLVTLIAGVGQRGQRRSFPTMEQMGEASKREKVSA